MLQCQSGGPVFQQPARPALVAPTGCIAGLRPVAPTIGSSAAPDQCQHSTFLNVRLIILFVR